MSKLEENTNVEAEVKENMESVASETVEISASKAIKLRDNVAQKISKLYGELRNTFMVTLNPELYETYDDFLRDADEIRQKANSIVVQTTWLSNFSLNLKCAIAKLNAHSELNHVISSIAILKDRKQNLLNALSMVHSPHSESLFLNYKKQAENSTGYANSNNLSIITMKVLEAERQGFEAIDTQIYDLEIRRNELNNLNSIVINVTDVETLRALRVIGSQI